MPKHLSQTKRLTSGHGELVAGDLREFLVDVPDDARIRINVDKGYGQFDPGGITIEVTTGE